MTDPKASIETEKAKSGNSKKTTERKRLAEH